ncbi:MAG: DUF188 domain-containing protein [Desulfobacteraceae bacterium 4572_35.1]|nr:MAG: DUF188 domain-containing protein [Desulfobacteraceae bacterium 4572_35.1]
MDIWVDADACPKVIKEILYRVAERKKVVVTLVANQPLHIPSSRYLNFMLVGAGIDIADDKIIELIAPGDLVITADIPLAAAAIKKKGLALNPRGNFYTTDNIQERLTIRNMLDELRGCGVNTGGPAAFSATDKQAFANQLDRFLTSCQTKKST